MNYRTDLAIERIEITGDINTNENESKGINYHKTEHGDGVTSTMIEILDDEAEKRIGKPRGKYVTIEADDVLNESEIIKDTIIDALAAELKKMITFDYHLRVLVAGLGNMNVTPDALGPKTASKVKVTGHLFMLYGADGDEDMSNVCCIIPGVTATTGLETAELIRKAAELSKPDAVVVIDSLAAKDISRLSTTIQITDTGICPGSGMGNHRTGINKETIGVKVIAIGVPTVIDAATIIRDALLANEHDVQKTEKYITDNEQEMIVTSTEIDLIIKEFSDIISSGINKTLHPGIY